MGMKCAQTKLTVNIPTEAVRDLQSYAFRHDISMTTALNRALGLQKLCDKTVTKGGKVLLRDQRGNYLQVGM